MTEGSVETEAEARAVAWLRDQHAAMVALLGEIVNIDSGSDDKLGVDAVGERLETFLAGHGFASRREHDATYGDAIRVGPETGAAGPLLMGHRDTVFPRGEAGRRPFTEDGGYAYGPGVADMKAGLVMNAFVAAATAREGGLTGPVRLLYTGDEEVGSPFSRPIIEASARAATAVFNAEPGRVSGNLVRSRKGGAFLWLRVTGKAAHSGANLRDGASAIEAIADKILKLHALTDFETGTTVNVGLVDGGQSVNTTAPWARARIDLRFATTSDRERVMARIAEIVAECRVAGTSASFGIDGEFVPLVPSAGAQRIFDVYKRAARTDGLDVDWEATGACADSGAASATGTPTVCGTGPVGGKPHTPDEYIETDSLVGRAVALARTIHRLDRDENSGGTL